MVSSLKKNIILSFIILFVMTISIQADAARSKRKKKIYNEECRVMRVAFYHGPVSTVGKLADVDKCKKKIISTIKQFEITIPYESTIRSSEGKRTIPQGMIYKGVYDLFNIIKKLGVDCKKEVECVGIAVDGIRDGRVNNKVYIKYLEDKLNIKTHIISKAEEGRLGFLGLFANRFLPQSAMNKVIIIDIREKDFKFSYLENNEVKAVDFGVGPAQFKRVVMKKIKEKIVKVNSPNPMTAGEVNKTMRYAENKISYTLERYTARGKDRKKSIISRDSKVFAVGDIVKKRIVPVVNPGSKQFDKVNILNSIKRLTGLSDEQIKFRYPAVSGYESSLLTDVIFLYSVMMGLRLETIHIIRTANDLDGLLVANQYWHMKKEVKKDFWLPN